MEAVSSACSLALYYINGKSDRIETKAGEFFISKSD